MSGIFSPKAGTKLPSYMKLSELQQFLRSLESDWHRYALRNETLFKLIATTGMRRAEITSLKWENIDLDINTVLIQGKGNKERLLHLHQLVIPIMKQYRDSLKYFQLYKQLISISIFLSKA